MKTGYVQLTDTTTGLTRTLPLPNTGLWSESALHPRWNWEHGNYSCNCNREIFFLRAGGEVLPDEELLTCSGDGRYTVKIVVDGNVVFCDDEETK